MLGPPPHSRNIQQSFPDLPADLPCFARPAGHFSFLSCVSPLWPALLPPVPTVLPVLSSPAEEPPVPSEEAEFEPSEPAAEPPVPSVVDDLPPPADEPPVPNVEAEPEPEPDPEADPPVPSVVDEVPFPAEEPPVPSVEAEPEPEQSPEVQPPEALPPVPMVELVEPLPAVDPPVPTVLLLCAKAPKAVLARIANANAVFFNIILSSKLIELTGSQHGAKRIVPIRIFPDSIGPKSDGGSVLKVLQIR